MVSDRVKHSRYPKTLLIQHRLHTVSTNNSTSSSNVNKHLMNQSVIDMDQVGTMSETTMFSTSIQRNKLSPSKHISITPVTTTTSSSNNNRWFNNTVSRSCALPSIISQRALTLEELFALASTLFDKLPKLFPCTMIGIGVGSMVDAGPQRNSGNTSISNYFSADTDTIKKAMTICAKTLDSKASVENISTNVEDDTDEYSHIDPLDECADAYNAVDDKIVMLNRSNAKESIAMEQEGSHHSSVSKIVYTNENSTRMAEEEGTVSSGLGVPSRYELVGHASHRSNDERMNNSSLDIIPEAIQIECGIKNINSLNDNVRSNHEKKARSLEVKQNILHTVYSNSIISKEINQSSAHNKLKVICDLCHAEISSDSKSLQEHSDYHYSLKIQESLTNLPQSMSINTISKNTINNNIKNNPKKRSLIHLNSTIDGNNRQKGPSNKFIKIDKYFTKK